MDIDLNLTFDQLPESRRPTVFNVDYAHLRPDKGGDLYVTRYGWPHVACLLPERWYEDHYYSNAGERMRGSTGTVYSVFTSPTGERAVHLIVKFSRMAQHVPLMASDTMPSDVDPEDVAAAVFNSPFEEFGLLMEMRRRPIPDGRPMLLTKRPLGIYVPSRRFPMWQMGRSKSRFHVHEHLLDKDQAGRANPVKLDIRRDYVMLFGWVNGIDAHRAADEGLLRDDELTTITAEVTEDLAARGFRVLDNKPKHYIVRPRRKAGRLLRRRGRVVYALIDFELLQRTAEYRRQVLAMEQQARWTSVPARPM